MRFPSIRAVRAALVDHRAWLRRTFNAADLAEPGQDPADAAGDVRLQVYEDGQWAIRTGDSSFDLDHRGFWGASFVPLRRCNLTAIARGLIEQAREQHAMSA